MSASGESFRKKEIRKQKEKKKKAKLEKKKARKEREAQGGLDDMIAWVDENGNPTDTPPDPDKKKEEIDPDDIRVSVPSDDEVGIEDDPVREGVVDYYNDEKGFGFVIDGETKESVFVHINNVQGEDEIREGMRLQFEVEKGAKGPAAVNVKIVR